MVKPKERLTWPRTIGLGAQHVLAMFGSTFVVPLLTGFPPSTTIFFSAIGTILFLIITGNRLPSYVGSSFAFIAPITAAVASGGEGAALGGLVATGLLLAVVGVVVHVAGTRWIEVTMPPVVTGSIVMLIGLNLAPAAWGMVQESMGTALVSALAVVIITVLFRGILGRLSILLGTVVGCIVAAFNGEYDLTDFHDAAWFGLPDFATPTFDASVMLMFLPVIFVLIAENIGHVKSVSAMTGEDLDPITGRALLADGVATTVAGLGGGSGTTTYAENIGVMAATRVYSTAAYWCAGIFALLLSLSPKIGEAHRGHPGGRPRRPVDRAVRHDRRPRCPHLGPGQGRLRQPGEPHPRGCGARHGSRQLHVAGGRTEVRGHHPRHRRRAHHVPPDGHHHALA
ncbi:hypothetical protein GCM10025876_35860 [Demequina litorisediminis]|uniref:Pyrimidine permease RutG n=1 Tax=Demequina litorisediminis TaxID=1849022 RepID=A0ABQ6IJQ0_9MICO|nr:hypothetical protein GCM10025876_35860 [Demequina litorisediminis]